MAGRKKEMAWAPAAAAAAALACGRLLIGGVGAAAPGAGTKVLFGRDVPDARPAIAMLGVRDAALAIGLLRALHAGGRTRDWLVAGAACDVADALVAVRHRRTIGRRSALVALAAAAGAVTGVVAATRLD